MHVGHLRHLLETKRYFYGRYPAPEDTTVGCPHILDTCFKLRDFSWPIAVEGLLDIIAPRVSLDIWRSINDFAKGIPPDEAWEWDDGVGYTIDWVSQMMLQAKRYRLLNEVYPENSHYHSDPIFVPII